MDRKIKANKAQCNNCKEIIESKHKHDFVVCNCYASTKGYKGIFIDGGTDYLRWGGDFENIIDLVEYENDKNVDEKPKE